jgi:hypothetical protein
MARINEGGAPHACSSPTTPVLRKNLRGDRFQQLMMMQAAETWPSNDTMSGW